MECAPVTGQEKAGTCWSGPDIPRKGKILHDRTSTPPSLPEEVWMKILVRLPAKTLVKLKVVCRSWRNLITSGYFVGIHLDHWRSRFGLISVQHQELPQDIARAVYSERTTSSGCCGKPFWPIVSCDGLILAERICTCSDGADDVGLTRSRLFMCNPITTSTMSLPEIKYSSSSMWAIVRTRSTGHQYKVLGMLAEDLSSSKQSFRCYTFEFELMLRGGGGGVVAGDCYSWIRSSSSSWKELTLPLAPALAQGSYDLAMGKSVYSVASGQLHFAFIDRRPSENNLAGVIVSIDSLQEEWETVVSCSFTNPSAENDDASTAASEEAVMDEGMYFMFASPHVHGMRELWVLEDFSKPILRMKKCRTVLTDLTGLFFDDAALLPEIVARDNGMRIIMQHWFFDSVRVYDMNTGQWTYFPLDSISFDDGKPPSGEGIERALICHVDSLLSWK